MISASREWKSSPACQMRDATERVGISKALFNRKYVRATISENFRGERKSLGARLVNRCSDKTMRTHHEGTKDTKKIGISNFYYACFVMQ
jgi:hypothetical protein